MRQYSTYYYSYIFLLIVCILTGFATMDLHAQEDSFLDENNSEQSDDFNDFDDDFGDFTNLDEDKTINEINWGIGFEGLVSTYLKQDPDDIFKKNEIDSFIKYKFGKQNIFFYTDTRLYLLPLRFSEMSPEYYYSNGLTISRNGTISVDYSELIFRELYINYEVGRYIIKAGNQLHSWGTADVFSPTSYFNPYDIREFLFKNQDTELQLPVPSLSISAAIKNDSLEMIIVPLHVPARMMQNDSFWAVNYSEGPFPITIADNEGLDFNIKNIGAGIKYYKNIKGVDSNFSLYHGPDRDPSLRPLRTISEPGEKVKIEIMPEYSTYDAAGVALSGTLDSFLIQGELVYSFNKLGIIEKDVQAETATQHELSSLLPFDTTNTHFISYTIGFNYFVPLKNLFPSHNTECVYTMEWTQSLYLDKDIMKPFLSDIIVMRFQDNFFNKKLTTMLSVIFNTYNNSLIVMPELKYNITASLNLSAMYNYMKTEEGNYFSNYGDKDFFQWRLSYEM